MDIGVLLGFALRQSAQPTTEAIESGLQGLSQLVIGHGPYINFFSALVAPVCAMCLLFPPLGPRLVGRWVKYVGLGFVTFFLLHALRYLHWLSGGQREFDFAVTLAIHLLSILNNLLFLAAGMILLNEERPSMSGLKKSTYYDKLDKIGFRHGTSQKKK